ncbi:MAG: IS630 family transposase [Verrucomicrobiota bacterium]
MRGNGDSRVERKVVETLTSTLRNRTASAREVQRARLILLYLEGQSKSEISRTVGLSRMRVIEWINRFEADGLAGLEEREGRGRKESYTAAQRKRIVETVCRKPRKGLSRWSVRTLAKHLSIDKDKVHRVLREHDLHPHRLRTFNFSPDPQFGEKLLEVVGLYVDPPENAIVLCMDEKTAIQALDRTQPVLNLRSSKPKAWSNEYVRHGTRTMLAAVEVGTGKATTWVNKTRKTADFITFMNQVVKAYPKQRLCVVLDNLNTHNGKAAQDWLERHPRVTFHYTPTHASWVNLAECFFSILTKQGLEQSVHRSARALERFLEAFVSQYNERARPLVWTKGPDKLKKIIKLTEEFQATTV